MTFRKYAHGRVLEEDAPSADKTAAAKETTPWTAKDQAELAEENTK